MRTSVRCLLTALALLALGLFSAFDAERSPASGGYLSADRALLSPSVSAAPVQQQGKRIAVKLAAGAGETVGVTANGRIKRPGRDFKLRRAVATVVGGAKTQMTLRTRKNWQERKLQKALRNGRTLTAVVNVKLADLLGNGIKRTLTIKLT